MISLKGRRILVTGAAGGIGRAVSEMIAEAGGGLVLADLTRERAEPVAARLMRHGGRIDVLGVDVTSRNSVQALVEATASTGPAIDGVVNSAGVSLGERLEDDDFFVKWDRSFRINVDGPAHVIRGFVGQLKSSRGSVVNIASTCAFQAGNGPTGYTASKGAVRLMTQSFARDLAPYGIRVNAVAPALVATEMTLEQRQDAAKMANFNVRSMMKRPGEPHEVAGPIVFLLSSLASYMTGATIPVDGGILA